MTALPTYTPRQWDVVAFGVGVQPNIGSVFASGAEPGTRWQHYVSLDHPVLLAYQYAPEAMEYAIVSDEEFKALGVPQFIGEPALNLGRLSAPVKGHPVGTPALHLYTNIAGAAIDLLFILKS
jgi:hypothetical protein